MPKAVIEAVTSYLPDRILTNEELENQIESWTAEKILEKTGIRERRIAENDECASDLAVKAAEKLFEQGKASRDEIDYILFCTQAPDYFLPTSACLIQNRLGLPRTCGAIDFNQGCSGYVIGLSLARGLIESGQSRSVLLLTGETYSKYIHPKDRSVCTLFGDGATATIIRAKESGAGIGEFILGTDGRGGKNLIVPTGAMRQSRSEKTAVLHTDKNGNTRTKDNLYMNGPEVFRFAIQRVPKTIRQLLDKVHLTHEDIDFLILHQANRYMLDQLVKRIPIPKEKIPYEFEDIGNTVSSTIPIVLERLIDQDRLKSGDRLLLVGFGVGYSWAGGIVEWA